MKVNRTKDWLERTFWTFANTLLGLVTADSLGAFNIDFVHKLEAAAAAALFTTVKVVVAQRAGGGADGAAIPGGVIEPPPGP